MRFLFIFLVIYFYLYFDTFGNKKQLVLPHKWSEEQCSKGVLFKGVSWSHKTLTWKTVSRNAHAGDHTAHE